MLLVNDSDSFLFFNRLSQFIKTVDLGICNGDFNLQTRLSTAGHNLLNYLGGAVQVNEALVDSYLETIPHLWSLHHKVFFL